MDEIISFLESAAFELGNNTIDLGQVIGAIFALLFVFLLYTILNRVILTPLVIKRQKSNKQEKLRIIRRWVLMFILIGISLVIWIFNIDYTLIEIAGRKVSLLTVMVTLIVLSVSSLIDWVFTYIISNDDTDSVSYYERRSKQKFSPGSIIQFIIYTLAFILVLRGFNLDFKVLSNRGGEEGIDLYFSNLFIALLIILVARLIIWILTNLILSRYYKIKKIEYSSQFAINQILSYVIIVMAIIITLENMGVKMTLIWGGAAALLVGVGLGLQQTFNDLISGIILLFERTIEVGSVVEIDDMVGTVRKIGIRTSVIETRDNIAVIVPNSKLIVDFVINWNHNDDKARFNVAVGVAYGSDTELVRRILLEVIDKHPDSLKFPAPFVRFVEFSDSSLNMELHFWSQKLIPIENVKSDIRFMIDKAFRENNIKIPFPQRDIWIKKELGEQDDKRTSES